MKEETIVHVLEQRVKGIEDFCAVRNKETDKKFETLSGKIDMVLEKIIDLEKRLQNHLPTWASFLFALYSALLAGLIAEVLKK